MIVSRLLFLILIFLPAISLAQETAGVDAYLTLPDPEWRPIPNVAPQTRPIKIEARLRQPNDRPGIWRFTLFQVSREPGTAMNYGSETDPDLRFFLNQPGFAPPEPTRDGYAIQTSAPASRAAVLIEALDGAAWGRLKAEIQIDGVWHPCRSETGIDAFYTIPVDSNGNHIADSWEKASGVWSRPASSDEDAMPAGEEPGDGFSNFEEYRGFFTQAGWISTDPGHRDIFINDEAGSGVGYFWSLALKIHFISAAQYDGNHTRVVNFNRRNAGMPGRKGQLGLWLTAEDSAQAKAADRAVYARIAPPGPQRPDATEKIFVNLNLIAAHKTILQQLARRGAPQSSAASSQIDLNWIIARQLSRGVNLGDCGEPLETALAGAGSTSGEALFTNACSQSLSLTKKKAPKAETLGDLRRQFERGELDD